MPFDKPLRESENRRRWNRLVHEATNPWDEDGLGQDNRQDVMHLV